MPFYQQAATWSDLRSAVQAFCRGAGIDPSSLSAEAQAMLAEERARFEALSQRYYLLGYCSPARAGAISVPISSFRPVCFAAAWARTTPETVFRSVMARAAWPSSVARFTVDDVLQRSAGRADAFAMTLPAPSSGS
mgnify:CR=1 FL=1